MEDLFPDTRAVSVSRLAELVVRLPDGLVVRGSGYLVSRSAVITAWHVVSDAVLVEAVFEAGALSRWSVVCGPPLRLGGSDVALLPVSAEIDVSVTEFGGFGSRGVSLPGEVAGFPRWKIRSAVPATAGVSSKFRESFVEPAMLCSGSNRRGGGMAVLVSAPAPLSDTGHSPWEGLSGGPVFCRGALVGVVTDHHPPEGNGRLAAARLDRCLADVPESELPGVLDLMGISSAASMRQVVSSPGALMRSAYLERVRDIAPAGGLLDRDAETDTLARFCASEDFYLVLQAPAGAGKTALMSSFVLNPPAGVVVVSFFITGRLAGQSDSSAFTDALLDQLASIVGESIPAVVSAGSRDALRRKLLRDAVDRVDASGQRLVLVVDGLDEDTGTAPGSGLASVASLLPKHRGDRLKVIVSTRPDPPLPIDIRTEQDHPIHRAPIQPLASSPHARSLLERAEQELATMLAGPSLGAEIAGLVAAAGGGLAATDLQQLTGSSPFQLHALLNGPAGRTIAARAGHASGEPGYLFTHETLKESAERLLGAAALETYRARIHSWADGYRLSGWPAHTPQYLLTGYPQMLHAAGDTARLEAIASDTSRHDRLLDLTGGDHSAFTEIALAMRHLADADQPDLVLLTRLARRRKSLASRNKNVPTRLPAVWAMLGQFNRAEALAFSLPANDRQVKALTTLVDMLIEVDSVRAEEVARRIADEHHRHKSLATLVHALAPHDPDRAETIARSVEALGARSVILAGLAMELVSHDPVRAEQIAISIADPDARRIALNKLAEMFAGCDPERSRHIADLIDNPADRGLALAHLARGMTKTDPAEAKKIATEAIRLFHHGTEQAGHEWQLEQTISLLAPDRGLLDPTEVSLPASRLAAAARKIIASGETDNRRIDFELSGLLSALALLDAAEAVTIAEGVADWKAPSWALHGVLRFLATTDSDKCEALVRTIARRQTDESIIVDFISDIAGTQPVRAETIGQGLTDPRGQTRALLKLLHHAESGDPTRIRRIAQAAETAAQQIADLSARLRAMADLIAVMTRIDCSSVDALTVTAEHMIPANPDRDQERALRHLSTALAPTNPAAAERIARSVTGQSQSEALADLAKALIPVDVGHAEAVAQSITHVTTQSKALADLAKALIPVDPHHAEAVARSIATPKIRAESLAELAATVAKTDPVTAQEIALGSEQAARAVAYEHEQVWEAAQIAKTLGTIDIVRAETFIRRLSNGNVQDWALHEFIPLISVLPPDDRLRAATMACDIAELSDQNWAFSRVAESLAMVDPQRAEQVANRIPDQESRDHTLAAIIRIVAPTNLAFCAALLPRIVSPAAIARGRTDLAIATAATDPATAEEMIAEIKSPEEQQFALKRLFYAMLVIDHDRAEQMTPAITGTEAQAWALAALAGELAKCDIARAQAIAEGITDPAAQASATAGIATALADTDFSRAERMVLEMENGDAKARALANLVERADLTDALRLADAIEDHHVKARALAQLATAHATVNFVDASGAARKTLTMLKDSQKEFADEIVAQLIPALAKADAHGTEELVRSVEDPSTQMRALAELAKQVAATDAGHAERVAQSIDDPTIRSNAMVTVATTLVAADPAHAAATAPVVNDVDMVDMREHGRLTMAASAHNASFSRRACILVAKALLLNDDWWSTLPAMNPSTRSSVIDDFLNDDLPSQWVEGG